MNKQDELAKLVIEMSALHIFTVQESMRNLELAEYTSTLWYKKCYDISRLLQEIPDAKEALEKELNELSGRISSDSNLDSGPQKVSRQRDEQRGSDYREGPEISSNNDFNNRGITDSGGENTSIEDGSREVNRRNRVKYLSSLSYIRGIVICGINSDNQLNIIDMSSEPLRLLNEDEGEVGSIVHRDAQGRVFILE